MLAPAPLALAGRGCPPVHQRLPPLPPWPHRPRSVPLSDWDLPDAPDFNTRTNAELVDAGLAHQALSAHDIEAMKASLRLSSASLFLFFLGADAFLADEGRRRVVALPCDGLGCQV